MGWKNYSGTTIGPKWKPGFTKAIKYWVPSIAVAQWLSIKEMNLKNGKVML